MKKCIPFAFIGFFVYLIICDFWLADYLVKKLWSNSSHFWAVRVADIYLLMPILLLAIYLYGIAMLASYAEKKYPSLDVEKGAELAGYATIFAFICGFIFFCITAYKFKPLGLWPMTIGATAMYAGIFLCYIIAIFFYKWFGKLTPCIVYCGISLSCTMPFFAELISR